MFFFNCTKGYSRNSTKSVIAGSVSRQNSAVNLSHSNLASHVGHANLASHVSHANLASHATSSRIANLQPLIETEGLEANSLTIRTFRSSTSFDRNIGENARKSIVKRPTEMSDLSRGMLSNVSTW